MSVPIVVNAQVGVDEYTSARFEETIAAFASASPDECHSAFFNRRDYIIAQLKVMAQFPSEPSHQAWLRTVDFFLYTRRASVFYS